MSEARRWRREVSAPATPRANSNGDGRRKRRTAKEPTTTPGIPGVDGLITCPRCRTRWPQLHAIFDQDDAVEWACEACVFDDVYAGRVGLRKRKRTTENT